MSERTSEKISAAMSARIEEMKNVDFEAKARKILSQQPAMTTMILT